MTRGRAANLTPAEHRERHAAYEEGLTDAELAARFDRHVNSMRAWRMSQGLPANVAPQGAGILSIPTSAGGRVRVRRGEEVRIGSMSRHAGRTGIVREVYMHYVCVELVGGAVIELHPEYLRPLEAKA